jgi:hypothetical protein
VLVRNPQFLWKTLSWLLPGLLFYYVQICTGKGPHYVAPFDSERAAGQRHRHMEAAAAGLTGGLPRVVRAPFGGARLHVSGGK